MGIYQTIRRHFHSLTYSTNGITQDFTVNQIRIPLRYLYFQHVRLPIAVRRALRSAQNSLQLLDSMDAIMKMIDAETEHTYGYMIEQYGQTVQESHDMLLSVHDEYESLRKELVRAREELEQKCRDYAVYYGANPAQTQTAAAGTADTAQRTAQPEPVQVQAEVQGADLDDE